MTSTLAGATRVVQSLRTRGRPMTHRDYLETSHFPALDGLRAIAALLVISFHYAGSAASRLSGSYGLPVFFVLSGYLITTLALREETDRGSVSVPHFWTRRIFRIAPVYIVVVLLTLAHERMVAVADFAYTARLSPYFFSFNSEYAPPSNLLHTWTIGIEQKFYLVWPLLAFLVTLKIGRRIALAGILTLLAAVAVLVTGIGFYINYGVILVGCLLAIVMHDRRGFRVIRWLTQPAVAFTVAAAFIVFHLSIPTIRQHLSEEQAFMLYAGAMALLIPAVVCRGLPRLLLTLPPLVYVGKRSYSLYLVQVLASQLVAWTIPGIGHSNGTYGVFVTTTGIAIASILYVTVEMPFIRLGRRVLTRPR